ncbi:Phosphonoacetaldehyde hydrolase [subsurface metagenome]
MILDLARSTVNYVVHAPVVVFIELYKRQGVEIIMEEARATMCAHKKVHIQEISEMPAVGRRWQEVKGRAVTPEDIYRMLKDFEPLKLSCLTDYTKLILSTLEVFEDLKNRGRKTGSNTGYTGVMVDINRDEAKKQGYVSDNTAASDEVLA